MISYFKWYRRWRGGKWAKATDPLGLFCQWHWIKVPDSTVERVDEDYTPKILTLPNPWSVVDGNGVILEQSVSRSAAVKRQFEILCCDDRHVSPLTVTNERGWILE